jgi:ATP-binding cassette subfamily B protein
MNKMLKKLFPNSKLLRFLSFLRGKWRFLYPFGLISVSSYYLLSNLATAFGIKMMTEGIIGKNTDTLLSGAAFFFFGLLIVTAMLPFIWFLYYRTTLEIKRNVLHSLYEKIYEIPCRFMENKHSGDLISRLTNDVETSNPAYGWQMKMIVQSTIAGIGSLFTILILEWRFGLIAISLGGLIVLSNSIMAKPMRRISRKIQEALSIITQRLTDNIAGREVIKIFNLKKRMLEIFEKAGREAWDFSMKRIFYRVFLQAVGSFVHMFSFAGFFAIGGFLIISGELEFGTLMAVINLLGGVLWMFRGFGDYVSQIQGSLAGADRIFEIIDHPDEKLVAPANAEDFSDQDHTDIIELRGISFTYEGGIRVFQDLNLSIRSREKVAIVGSSGGGKSTLFKLLLGFYNVQRGSIIIYGKLIHEYRFEELREFIAYVPQDSYLFDGTVRENIEYGRPDALFEAVEASARAAYANEFIRELPDGYDTLVGERGIHLSGGQRQRIAVARALLKDAPILLLDEATSSLDSESEQHVQMALKKLMRGRTTLVIAHRLSTVRDSDRILVLEKGEIREEGTHEVLLREGGRYAELYSHQFRRIYHDS